MAHTTTGGGCATGTSSAPVWPDRRRPRLSIPGKGLRQIYPAYVGFRGTLSSLRGRTHRLTNEERQTMARNVICLWYDGTAEEAARFYAQTFPNSAVTAGHRAPGDYPAGKEGQVLTVEFTVLGIPCLGLNGGPTFN